MSLERSLPVNEQYKRWNIKELVEKLEEAYEGYMEPKTFEKPKESFAPSQVFYGSGKCPRIWHYKFRGGFPDIHPEFSPESVFNMETGTASHERLQKLFEKAGVQLAAEREVTLDYPPVRGYLDSMIEWMGEHIPVEIKTARQEGFFNKIASMKPTAYQAYQVILYARILGSKVAILFYENRNSGEWLILPIEMTEEVIAIADYILDWMKEVWDNREELPTRPFTKSSPECKDCPFRTHCWSDEQGSIDIEPLVVNDF